MEIVQVLNIKRTYEANKHIADEHGIKYSTFCFRMSNNFTLEEALTLPLNTMKNKPDYSTQEHRRKERENVISNEQVILNKLELGIVPNKKEQAYMLEHKDKFKEWLR